MIPKLKLNTTIEEQLDKVYTEYNELKSEIIKGDTYKRDMEALDLLTATFNFIMMLNIPEKTKAQWRSKMIRYQTEKGYEIEKWFKLEGVE